MIKLVVLFLVAGSWTPMEGWGERSYNDMEDCVTASKYLHNYLKETSLPSGAKGVMTICERNDND